MIRLLTSVSITAFAAMWTPSAFSNPTGGTVVSGEAVITTPDPATLQIDQATDKAIIHWDNFDIESGETTRFNQPNSASVVLNRDFAGDPSRILGNLKATGQVFLVNRNGVLFGRNARVDTAGLVATTHDITNENFLAGQYVFDQPGEANASIVNLGDVSIADQGLAAFVAPSVRNDGVIVARLGTVALAAANGFTLDMHGDEQLTLFVENPVEQAGYTIDGQPFENLVENSGRIQADGGYVVLTAAAARDAVNNVINHDGVIQANTVGVRNGKIVLGGDLLGGVIVAGDVSAVGADAGEKGGHITVTGEGVALLNNATIDASGRSGGGTILLGGDYKGGNGDPVTIAAHNIALEDAPVPTAARTILAQNTRVAADALEDGNGGKVIVWADEATISASEISARGGASSGDGGFVETSGLFLEVQTAADASAPNGELGTWLLDPIDVVVDDRSNRNSSSFDGFLYTITPSGESIFGRAFFPTDEPSRIDVDVIEAALNSGTNVTVDTLIELRCDCPADDDLPRENGNIEIKTDIRKRSGGDARLAFRAAGDIDVDRGVDFRSTRGELDVELAAFGGRIDADDIGRVDLNGGTFILQSRDGIDVSSDEDMPNLFIGVNRQNSSRSRVRVDVDFADDQVKFTHNDELISVPSGGILLVEPGVDSGVSIRAERSLSLELSDRAILNDSRRWSFNNIADAGAAQGDSLNDVPEIIGGARFFVRPNDPTSGVFPVIEVSDDEGLTVDRLIPTSPTGESLVAAILELEEVQRDQRSRSVTQRIEKVKENNKTQSVIQNDDLIGPIQYIDPETEQINAKIFAVIDKIANPKSIYDGISAALEIRELLSLYKDAKTAQDFIFKHLIPSTGLSDVEKIFQKKASISIVNATVSIVADVFVESYIEATLTEKLGLEDSTAESAAATIKNLGLAPLTGGGSIIAQLIDQATIIASASREASSARDNFERSVLIGADLVVSAFLDGNLSKSEALESLGFSSEINSNFRPYNQTYKHVEIIVRMAEVKIEQGNIGLSTLAEGELYNDIVLMSGAIDRTEPPTANYFPFANEVARRFGVVNWRGHSLVN